MQTAPPAANATTAPSDASHITIEGSLKTAPLAYYISKLAGEFDHKQLYEPVFRSSPGLLVPTLRNDRENRVLLYPGCFNPPHLGHAALLWHAYLCTDDKTIAAIILPVDTDGLSCKDATEVDGKEFVLSKHKRTQLWEDKALRNFTWIWTAEPMEDTYKYFLISLQIAVQEDGFDTTFPTLHGGDHVAHKNGNCRGDCTEIASDIARPVLEVRGKYEEVKFINCKKWRKVAMTQGQKHDGGPVPCRSCWRCRKLRGICPGVDELTRANQL